MTSANQPTGLGWALWVVAAALPWLLPIHGEPWAGFYSEALAAAVMVPAAIWVGVRSTTRWALDWSVLVMVVLAGVPIVQAQFGLFVLPGEAWLVALYLAGCAAAMLVARQAQLVEPLRLIEASLAAIAVAALLSAGLALYQWLEQDWLGIVVHYSLVSGRAYANLGQPNNLATLLCWGVVAVWWGYHRRKLGPAVAAVAVAYLALGLVLTRSRTGWIEVALLVLAALYIRWRHRTGPTLRAVALLSSWFVVLAVGLEPLAHQVLREAPAKLSDQGAVGLRPTIWRVAVDEIEQRPLTGHGWNQSVPAYLTVVEQHQEVRLVVNHAHNVALDLLVWNGIPLGLAILGCVVWWAWRQARASRTQEQRLLLLALALLGAHAMLELPHTYLFFLLPAAVMAGTLGALSPTRSPLAMPRGVALGVCVALGLALVSIVHDYQAIERDLHVAKMKAAHIHNPNPSPPSSTLFLGFLQTALQRMHAEPVRDVPREQLAAMRHTLDRYPLPGALFRYARVAALAGQPDEARWALDRLCVLNPSKTCDTALRDWGDLVAQGSPELAAVQLPMHR